jgi:hypothetical protein
MGATRKSTKTGMGAMGPRGTMPARPRASSAPPPLVCPSPLPPKLAEQPGQLDEAELRRRMTTAPPPEQAREGAEAAPRSTARRSKRASLRVDDVGTAGLGLSAKQTPRLAKGRRDLAQAPIDPKAAFVLSQIDGRVTVDDLADLTAMSRDDVLAILQRCVRLGLVLL